jgi:hypothetical protein
MNIDNNTIVFTVLSLAAAYFAFGYFKAKYEAKMRNIHVSINDVQDEMWRQREEMSNRIDRLEKSVECCSRQSACNRQGTQSY